MYRTDRAGIAQWYSPGLRAGWSEVRVPAGVGNFSLHRCVHTSSGDHQASYPVVPLAHSLGVKQPGRETDHSTWIYFPRSRIRGAIPPLPHFALRAWCLVKAQRQLYLYLTHLTLKLCHVPSFIIFNFERSEWVVMMYNRFYFCIN
jgi:hypothetical protein